MKIFYNAADKTGSGYYRMYLPAKYLSLAGHNIKMNTNSFPDKGQRDNLNLYIVQRGYSQESLTMVESLKQQGVTTAYDLDDDFWSIPDSNPRKDAWPEEKIRQAEQVMAACGYVIVSTQPLADLVRKFNPKVVIIPNYVEALYPTRKVKNKALRLGWAGGDSHEVDFTEEIVETLLYVKKKFQWELVFFGFIPEKLMGKVRFIRHVEPTLYLPELHSLNLDIGIAPLADIPFNKSKSPIKAVEYGALRIPYVASDIYPYRNHPGASLLAENTTNSWLRQFEILRDARLRQSIGERAHDYVQEHNYIKNKINEILGFYEKMIGK